MCGVFSTISFSLHLTAAAAAVIIIASACEHTFKWCCAVARRTSSDTKITVEQMSLIF
jgi:hypothetical protein